ncbi:MAG: DUF4845 domain-containing protein, partial [Thiobacillaceae bacterium]|nr:DUF4845 domain-containing protein [Thiobacillaceae bacterium]
MIKTQRGLTLTGLLFFSLLVIFLAYLASRLLPPFLDYWAVKRAVAQMVADPALMGQPEAAYRDAFQKRLRISDIKDVERRDLVLEKDKGGARLVVDWTVRRPFIGPVNLCMDF